MDQSTKRALRFDLSLTVSYGIAFLGFAIIYALNQSSISLLDNYGNSFFVLFRKNEPVILIILTVSIILLHIAIFCSTGNIINRVGPTINFKTQIVTVLIPSFIAMVFVGNFYIFYNFPLSNDEFLPRFQTQIFSSGLIKSRLPSDLSEFWKSLTPIFVLLDPHSGTWTSAYLPVYAILRTLFFLVGEEALTGPVLGGLSLLLLFLIARRIWPKNQSAPFLSVILLASSSQFLITSMTSYAYPAHLFLNLGWLYCYIRGDRIGYLTAPWVGFLALGVHNPFTHALFVLPFLFSILFKKRWLVTLYFASVYFAGCVTWFIWWIHIAHFQSSNMSVFALPGPYQFAIQPMNIVLLFTWQSLCMSLPFFISAFSLSHLSPVFKLLFISFLLTFVFYFFFPVDQVLGWGYRFIYGCLGNLAILATGGLYMLKDSIGSKKVAMLIAIGTLASLLFQFPIRCYQAHSFTKPFAISFEYLKELPFSFLIIDPSEVWFSQLLVRNDPFLTNVPKIMFSSELSVTQLYKLESHGTVHKVQPEELSKYGMHPIVKTTNPR
jgi:hypothetical protein